MNEPARRLPEMPRTRTVSLGDQLEVDGQPDGPGEHVAAARQLGLKGHAPVAAVDLGLEVQRGAAAAVDVLDRAEVGAGGGDRPLDPAHRQQTVEGDGAVVGEVRGVVTRT